MYIKCDNEQGMALSLGDKVNMSQKKVTRFGLATQQSVKSPSGQPWNLNALSNARLSTLTEFPPSILWEFSH